MKNNIKTIFISTFLFLALSSPVFAGEIYVDAPRDPVGQNSVFTVSIMLDPKGSFVNALEGKVILPPGLEIISIDDSGTLVSSWVQKPELKNSSIYFSGIVLGGFRGLVQANSERLTPGILFKVHVKSPENGDFIITPSIDSAYEKDGQLINPVFTSRNTKVSVSKTAPIVRVNNVVDIHPPESFTVDISRDSNLFNGRYFIVFNTTDAGTGVDFYSVEEGDLPPVTATSPYMLKDQSRRSLVVVRAYDRVGNVQTSVVEPEPVRIGEMYYIIISIALVFLIGIGLSLWKRRSLR